jgi:hypothetical protein
MVTESRVLIESFDLAKRHNPLRLLICHSDDSSTLQEFVILAYETVVGTKVDHASCLAPYRSYTDLSMKAGQMPASFENWCDELEAQIANMT